MSEQASSAPAASNTLQSSAPVDVKTQSSPQPVAGTNRTIDQATAEAMFPNSFVMGEPGDTQSKPTPEKIAALKEKDAQAEVPPLSVPNKEDATKTEEAPKPESVPEPYDLTLPKDSPLEASYLDEIKTFAKEKGLKKEDAQALIERESTLVSKFQKNLEQKAIEANKQIIEVDWVNEIKSDKVYGGENFEKSKSNAQRALKAYATPEYIKELEETGYGNHPNTIRAWAMVGKAMASDTAVHGQTNAPSTQKKPMAQILYPNMNP